MVQTRPYPPIYHHPSHSAPIAPSTARQQLSSYLTTAKSHPHLHPDSQLSTSGIHFSPQSGPKGGLALHHLTRIEAGLRGENLTKESEDELKRKFGNEDEDTRPEGDDARLDALLPSGGRKRKRGLDRGEVGEWAESSSQAGAEVSVMELESFVNTPVFGSDAGVDVDEDEEGSEDGIRTKAFGSGERSGVGKARTGADKQARKEAKKARRQAEKRAMIEAAKKAEQDAVKTKQDAVKGKQDAIKADEDDMKAKQDAVTAKQDSVKATPKIKKVEQNGVKDENDEDKAVAKAEKHKKDKREKKDKHKEQGVTPKVIAESNDVHVKAEKRKKEHKEKKDKIRADDQPTVEVDVAKKAKEKKDTKEKKSKRES